MFSLLIMTLFLPPFYPCVCVCVCLNYGDITIVLDHRWSIVLSHSGLTVDPDNLAVQQQKQQQTKMITKNTEIRTELDLSFGSLSNFSPDSFLFLTLFQPVVNCFGTALNSLSVF